MRTLQKRKRNFRRVRPTKKEKHLPNTLIDLGSGKESLHILQKDVALNVV